MLVTCFFLISLPLALAAAQILAGLVIVVMLCRLPASWPRPEVRFATGLALIYLLPLAALGFWHEGLAGAGLALKATWPVLLLPAGALAAPVLGNTRWSWWWLGVFVIAALKYLVQYAWYGYIEVGQVIQHYGFLTAPYAFALILIPPALACLARPLMTRRTAMMWLLFTTALIALNSRGALIAYAAAVAWVLLTGARGESSVKRRLVVAAGCVIILLFAAGAPERWLSTASPFLGTSNQHRLVIWSQVTRECEEAPWLGHGFARFRPLPARVNPEFYHYLAMETNPHNGYLMMWHSAGVFGYVLLWGVFATVFYRLQKRPRREGDWLSSVAIANLVAVMVAALTDRTFFLTLPMLQTWFLCGLATSNEQ